MRIRKANQSDIRDIKVLSDQCFGEDYLSLASIGEYLESSSWHLAVCEDKKGFFGFTMLFSGDFKAILSEIGPSHFNELSILQKQTRLCLHKSTCVASERTGQGLGSKMAEYAINEFPHHTHVSISWKRRNKAPMLHISQKLGYKILVEISEYWKEDSLKKNYGCPECGPPPCNCSALVLVRE